jgi:hypothetical protein
LVRGCGDRGTLPEQFSLPTVKAKELKIEFRNFLAIEPESSIRSDRRDDEDLVFPDNG